jgi:hypothetical protein
MRSVRSRRRPAVARAFVAAVVVVGLGLVASAPSGRASSYPTPPLAFDREFLSNLSAPSVGPGGSSTVSFRLYDPPYFGALAKVVLGLEVYALNGYPGTDVGPVPAADAPVLENGSASGRSVNVSLSSLSPGASYDGSVAVVTSAATPAGTYAVRTALSFVENHSGYLFESRGWFTESAWENATEGAGGSATVNASRLGVSGIVPETAVYVAPSGWPLALGALVAAGLILVGLGAWLYFRKGPGSRAGAGNDPAPGATNAPSALGRSRRSPGDSRSS